LNASAFRWDVELEREPAQPFAEIPSVAPSRYLVTALSDELQKVRGLVLGAQLDEHVRIA